MVNFLIGLMALFALADVARAETISCFTNYGPNFGADTRLRLVASREGESLEQLEIRYFNGRSFVPLKVTLDKRNNPDPTFKPRSYKGYLRYLATGERRGVGYEVLLPEKPSAQFRAFFAYSDFEDSSKRFELLCKSEL